MVVPLRMLRDYCKMGGIPQYGRGLLVLLSCILSFCLANGGTVQLLGVGECADCKDYNFKSSQAFSGLHVTVECKLRNGEYKRRGTGELDSEGQFKISLPEEVLKDGKLNEECYAQLYSASSTPCPAHESIEASKIAVKYASDGGVTLSPTKNIKFSSALCTSAFLWPYFKHPPLPDPWHKPGVPVPYHKYPKHFPWKFPPKIPVYKKPLPPLPPIYKPPVVKKPCPPTVPKPPVVKKPLPPPVPIYKPKPPVYKPPVIKKPLPPPVPIYKPKPPAYKPPVIVKPLPPPHPSYKPPFFKKPCPPLPKIPHHKFPPIPHFPPKSYFHHPLFPPSPPYNIPQL